jgi:hypothetical protein
MEWWRRLTTSRKVLVAAGGAAVLYLGYRYYQSKKAASSSGGAVLQPTSGPAPTTPPTATVTLPGGASYSGPASGLGGVLGALQQGTAPATTTTATPPPPPTAPAAPSQPGYGVTTINGQQYVILGEAAPGSNPYNVGGGAPVYYGNANNIAQGKAAAQQAASTGGYEYVPIAYASQVGATPGAPAPGQPGYHP